MTRGATARRRAPSDPAPAAGLPRRSAEAAVLAEVLASAGPFVESLRAFAEALAGGYGHPDPSTARALSPDDLAGAVEAWMVGEGTLASCLAEALVRRSPP